MYILGNLTVLRAMEPTDMDALRESVNNPEIERMVGGWSFPISSFAQSKWYEKVIASSNGSRMIIENLASNEPIGMISLTDIDWKNRTGKEAIKLFTNSDKKSGIGTDALLALLDYAFIELGLNRITANVIEYNVPSIKLHEKVGFICEGIQRQAVYKQGDFRNELSYAILKEDFIDMELYKEWKRSLWGGYSRITSSWLSKFVALPNERRCA